MCQRKATKQHIRPQSLPRGISSSKRKVFLQRESSSYCGIYPSLAALLSLAALSALALGPNLHSLWAAAWGGPVQPPLLTFFAGPLPSTANCSELYLEQPVDQSDYNAGTPTWRQHYFVCDTLFMAISPKYPIFFYRESLQVIGSGEGPIRRMPECTLLQQTLPCRGQ